MNKTVLSFMLAASLSASNIVISKQVTPKSYVYFKDHHISDISKEFKPPRDDEEVVKYFGDLIFYHALPITKGTCGEGLEGPYGLLGKASHAPKLFCNSNFTEMTGGKTGERVIWGLFTFGTALATYGTLHDREFSAKLMKEYLEKSDLLELEAYLEGGHNIEVVREFDLDEYLDGQFVKTTGRLPSNTSNVLIFDKETAKWLYVDKTKRADELVVSWLSSLMKPRTPVTVILPEAITEPRFPSVVSLTKDEFETKMQFKTRIDQAIKDREKIISEMKAQYGKDIIERNKNIKLLHEEYKKEIAQINKEQDAKKDKLKPVIKRFMQIAFIMTKGKPSLSQPNYDAETEVMEVDFLNNQSNLSKRIAFKQNPSDAKEFKNSFSTVTSEGTYEMQGDVFKLKSIMVRHNGSKYIYEATETDNAPEKIQPNFDAEKGLKIVMTSEEEANMFAMQSNKFEQTKLASASSFKNKSSNRKK